MKIETRSIQALVQDGSTVPPPWDGRALIYDDNLAYVVWNSQSREALVVDPVLADWDSLVRTTASLHDYRFVAVIDTHTHADHISGAARLAAHLGTPLIHHHSSPTRRADIRISRDTVLPTAAGPIRFLLTPGHTSDCLTPIWGPFLFGGDTILYGDTGRDDLPTGSAADHWDSLEKIKRAAKPELLMLPGHDETGRASSWKTQLAINPSLQQGREAFIQDSEACVTPPPRFLRESLLENFK